MTNADASTTLFIFFLLSVYGVPLVWICGLCIIEIIEIKRKIEGPSDD